MHARFALIYRGGHRNSGRGGGGGGGSVMNNQQGEGAEAFGGPALVHWMIRYITWGVVNCFR